jgi:hypothetical protein
MPVRKVRGEPVPGRFPALVSETQSFAPRHRAEGAGDRGVNGFDPLHRRAHLADGGFPMREGTSPIQRAEATFCEYSVEGVLHLSVLDRFA